jgi:hypothetical protein
VKAIKTINHFPWKHLIKIFDLMKLEIITQ